ncbi:MAG TPA: DUF4190 domain-containing protein [Verrucomicrobiae bacterium]|nr:DUF4190 domain-containing protein [Verrucomicrobiae bacterium]
MNDQVPPIPPATVAPSAKTSGLAIASLVLGILGLICILPVVGAILAVILGVLALNQINKSSGTVKGQGQAIAGIVLGGVGLVMIPMMAAMLLPALSAARQKARVVMCMNNLRQIGMATGLYSAEHDGFIPKEFNDLRPYNSNLDKLLICPSAKNTSNPSYRILLGGQKWNDQGIWKEIAVTELATNHRFGYNALYGDGHVEFLRQRRND